MGDLLDLLTEDTKTMLLWAIGAAVALLMLPQSKREKPITPKGHYTALVEYLESQDLPYPSGKYSLDAVRRLIEEGSDG